MIDIFLLKLIQILTSKDIFKMGVCQIKSWEFLWVRLGKFILVVGCQLRPSFGLDVSFYYGINNTNDFSDLNC